MNLTFKNMKNINIIVIGAVSCFAIFKVIEFKNYSSRKASESEMITVADKHKVIPVNVTLTKYQLEKMLDILETENSYGRPADPYDNFTFTSVARGNKEMVDGYNISSTHLARKPAK
tara:strand:+ start:358 stop:708 length:351 start_codon:yes stop_codon:yes gene_type:complete